MDLSLLQRRIFKDKAARWVMLVLTVLSLLLLIAIGIGLFFKSRLILSEHSLWELLSGSAWKPLSGEFGFLPFIVGTLFVTALSIAIALPISLLSAIFLTEYASSWVKRIVFPIFDILAGIPSVVYGVWGTLIIVPWIADKLGPRFVDYTSGYTVLASGIVLGIMAIITNGACAVMLERFDPLIVLASVHKERCTALYGVPTMFIAELNHPMFSMFDLSSLRTGIMAGSLCPEWLMREVMDKMYMTEITSVYGLTETSPGMTQSKVDDPLEVRATTVGSPLPEIDVKVIDPETLEECPVGVQGEMCCKGYNIMKGYYKMPEATAEIIDKNGYLHSGDLGVKTPEGNFKITGRIKDMIIRGGENIYPREIEEFLYQLPQIKDVQVAAVPSRKYGEEVGAFIILKDGETLEEADVKDFCKGKISRHKIPKYVFFIKEFPLTGSGKIQKYKLKDLGLSLLQEQGITPA